MNQETANKRENYPMFDCLRLFFASLVVVTHITAFNGYNDSKGVEWVFQPVPCFLALSGFMVLASRQSSRNALHFWQKRALRIGPAFLTALCLVALFYGISDVLPTLAVWWKFGTVASGHDGPIWSLSCEEVLYVAMAILWAIGAYKSKLAIWALFVASIFILFHLKIFPPEWRRVAMLPTCFLVGNLFYLHRDVVLKYSKWFWIALIISLVSYRYQGSVYTAFQIQVVATCFAFLMLGTVFTGRSWLKADVSYGVYVYHWPILTILKGYSDSALLLWIAGPLCVAAFSIASFYLIEKPALRLKNWRPARIIEASHLESSPP